jgi:hypothetical protein
MTDNDRTVQTVGLVDGLQIDAKGGRIGPQRGGTER